MFVMLKLGSIFCTSASALVRLQRFRMEKADFQKAYDTAKTQLEEQRASGKSISIRLGSEELFRERWEKEIKEKENMEDVAKDGVTELAKYFHRAKENIRSAEVNSVVAEIERALAKDRATRKGKMAELQEKMDEAAKKAQEEQSKDQKGEPLMKALSAVEKEEQEKFETEDPQGPTEAEEDKQLAMQLTDVWFTMKLAQNNVEEGARVAFLKGMDQELNQMRQNQNAAKKYLERDIQALLPARKGKLDAAQAARDHLVTELSKQPATKIQNIINSPEVSGYIEELAAANVQALDNAQVEARTKQIVAGVKSLVGEAEFGKVEKVFNHRGSVESAFVQFAKNIVSAQAPQTEAAENRKNEVKNDIKLGLLRASYRYRMRAQPEAAFLAEFDEVYGLRKHLLELETLVSDEETELRAKIAQSPQPGSGEKEEGGKTVDQLQKAVEQLQETSRKNQLRLEELKVLALALGKKFVSLPQRSPELEAYPFNETKLEKLLEESPYKVALTEQENKTKEVDLELEAVMLAAKEAQKQDKDDVQKQQTTSFAIEQMKNSAGKVGLGDIVGAMEALLDKDTLKKIKDQAEEEAAEAKEAQLTEELEAKTKEAKALLEKQLNARESQMPPQGQVPSKIAAGRNPATDRIPLMDHEHGHVRHRNMAVKA